MTELGEITDIDGEEIVLSCSSLSGGCKSCSGNSFCSANGKFFTALNEKKINLKSGDTVEFYMPPGRTIFAGFMVLIFPLISFIAFYGLSTAFFGNNEGIGVFSGILGLAAGFAITFYYNKVNKRKNTPRITKLINKG